MCWIVFFIIIALDQGTKYLILEKFNLYESRPIIEGIFHLTYVRNMGAAFSILQNQRTFFIIITSIIVLIIFWYILNNKNNTDKTVIYSLILIAGGAIGNLIDRIRFGYVVDFFDFIIWPVFNIADMSIVIGSILLGYFYIFLDKDLLLERKK